MCPSERPEGPFSAPPLPFADVERLEAASAWVRDRAPSPRAGLVLGSGLGHLAETMTDVVRLPYREIPGMPVPSVSGHGGELVIGRLGGALTACLSGRAHLYEGHAPERAVYGVRLLALLGVKAVVLTNAAGGMASQMTPGCLLLISDHLNLTGQNPLVGGNIDAFGPRFPDMSEAYDPRLRQLCREIAKDQGLPLSEGVYAGLLGPNYETPAEIRMLQVLGASAVGMSTVLETVALRQMGVRVLGLSCITNLAAGLGSAELNHEEVSQVAARVRVAFGSLVTAVMGRIDETIGLLP